MPLHGKRIASGQEARGIIEHELRESLKRAGFILQGFLMRNSPVKTGTLRRSWNVGEPQWHGQVFALKVGTRLVYARVVNARGTSEGYADRSEAQAKAQVKAAIQEGMRRAMARLKVDL